jgi:hypothetical protein
MSTFALHFRPYCCIHLHIFSTTRAKPQSSFPLDINFDSTLQRQTTFVFQKQFNFQLESKLRI